MNPVITIYYNADGTTRISRVTEHGEEVIQPNVEVAAICAAVWKQLATGSYPAETDILHDLPARVREAVDAITEARVALVRPLERVDAVLRHLETIDTRLQRLEGLLADRWMTVDASQRWMAEFMRPHARPLGGQ